MKRVCLIVLDGWGINPSRQGNAIELASTHRIAELAKEYPSTAIDTSGLSVGLPEGQMGNSEVGHLTMGAGRVIYQELTRISKAISESSFFSSPEVAKIIDTVRSKKSKLHLMGLLSDGGVHSHNTHLYGILEGFKKKGVGEVFIHAFLDGRDTPPQSGAGYMKELLSFAKKAGIGTVATVSGRYYAMDRDNRWERVKKAYDAMTSETDDEADDPVKAIEEAYARGETDEFVTPIAVYRNGKLSGRISDGDAVFFFNFRADRAREITRAFIEDDFKGFDRAKRPKLSMFLCMTEYDAKFGLPVVFKPQELKNILGEVLARNDIKQFRVSETEKYAHVTFFFNGGKEEPFEGEERLLIPSVKDVPTYDKKPEMRAFEIAQAAIEKIKEGKCSFMLMNFANGDMVGHTGVMEAAIKACEAVDNAVSKLVDAALEEGWAVIITSDHGNVEQMIDPRSGGPYTAHTTNLTPFILIDKAGKGARLRDNCGLKDIAPTVLKIMGIEKPVEMDGESIL